MSLVDYAAAARKRVPGWQGVAWQPGLTNTGARTFAVYARDPFGLTNSVIRTNYIFRTPPRP